jgi:hypothetical protein
VSWRQRLPRLIHTEPILPVARQNRI